MRKTTALRNLIYTLLAAIPAIRTFLREFRRTGSVENVPVELASFEEYLDILGYGDLMKLSDRYTAEAG